MDKSRERLLRLATQRSKKSSLKPATSLTSARRNTRGQDSTAITAPDLQGDQKAVGIAASSAAQLGEPISKQPSYLVPVAPAELAPLVRYSVKDAAYIPLQTTFDDSTEKPCIPDRKPHMSTFSSDQVGQQSTRLRNGLNCIHRGVQTLHWPPKETSTFSEPHETCNAAGSCSPWGIYEAYATKNPAVQVARDAQTPMKTPHSPEPAPSQKTTTLRVLERMLYQNLHHDVALDFQFWEDPADAVRSQEGTLLPLWTFAPPQSRGRTVTALRWNPRHPDLFAAGYGTFDPTKPLTGVICLHSLLDASRPETHVTLQSTPLCLDFHPTISRMVAVGCADGSVHVVDVGVDTPEAAVRASSTIEERHCGGVWHVQWTPVLLGQPPKLVTAAADGTLVGWEMGPSNDLRRDWALSLEVPGDSGCSAASCCGDVHPVNPSVVLLGTETGQVLRCDLDLGPEATDVFPGHASPVYGVRWSPFHPNSFLTASPDWSVRIWDTTAPVQMEALCFDLGAGVGDAAWSPHSSTTFAAVTDAGRVVVYDLAVSRDSPLCRQKVCANAALTKLAFNPVHPVLIVGDDKGHVMSFKLSPNLRKLPSVQLSEARATKAAALCFGDAMESDEEGDPSALAEQAQKLQRQMAEAQREGLQRVLQIAGACKTAEAAYDACCAAPSND